MVRFCADDCRVMTILVPRVPCGAEATASRRAAISAPQPPPSAHVPAKIAAPVWQVGQRREVQPLVRVVPLLDPDSFILRSFNALKVTVMAGDLHVRNLDDELIARLKRRAARHGRSTEAEHREILRQALAGEDEPPFDKLAADLRTLTKRRKQTPSEILLREGRGRR
jgi:plasmid stability protein